MNNWDVKLKPYTTVIRPIGEYGIKKATEIRVIANGQSMSNFKIKIKRPAN